MSEPTVEWCLEHLRHEQISACAPEVDFVLFQEYPPDHYYNSAEYAAELEYERRDLDRLHDEV